MTAPGRLFYHACTQRDLPSIRQWGLNGSRSCVSKLGARGRVFLWGSRKSAARFARGYRRQYILALRVDPSLLVPDPTLISWEPRNSWMTRPGVSIPASAIVSVRRTRWRPYPEIDALDRAENP